MMFKFIHKKKNRTNMLVKVKYIQKKKNQRYNKNEIG